MYLLGYDIGSSSVKAALVNAATGATVAVVQSPETELTITSLTQGWAEQDPELWWQHVCLATRKLLHKTRIKPNEIKGIGIAYQMHGLVLVDKNGDVLRPAIIWCDSRAVEIGNRAMADIGQEKCLSRLLNSPGNFTASKLKWVQQNEPHIYERVHKMMLPGDYIAMRLTHETCTTNGGLSEAILWDFSKDETADFLLDYFGFDAKVIPDMVPTFSIQGKLTSIAATETGLSVGTPVTYRAGDQPNNALSLNVLSSGEVAATGGTSGVVYGVVNRPAFDPQSRVNGFVHVNHRPELPRIGVLLCINGAGSQYRWIKQQVANSDETYTDMEHQAAQIPIGADGLRVLPFGNGAERMLGNRDIGSRMLHLQFNRHSRAHIYRAALEGIAFSFVYGLEIMRDLGLNLQVIRVGNDNLFQSQVFSQTISNVAHCQIECIETTGAVGAAKAAGVASGFYSDISEAMQRQKIASIYEPDTHNEAFGEAYQDWKTLLDNELNKKQI